MGTKYIITNAVVASQAGINVYLNFAGCVAIAAALFERLVQKVPDKCFSLAAMRVVTGKTVAYFRRVSFVGPLDYLRRMAGTAQGIRFFLEELILL